VLTVVRRQRWNNEGRADFGESILPRSDEGLDERVAGMGAGLEFTIPSEICVCCFRIECYVTNSINARERNESEITCKRVWRNLVTMGSVFVVSAQSCA
jgi:hypothetical protein